MCFFYAGPDDVYNGFHCGIYDGLCDGLYDGFVMAFTRVPIACVYGGFFMLALMVGMVAFIADGS